MRDDRQTALLMLLVVAGALVLSMTTWFSATAILPDLQRIHHLSESDASWLTNALQLGFVIAALGLSASGLLDALSMRRLMVGGCMLAAIANLSLLVAPGSAWVFAARAINGMALAAVYPPALKVLAGWFAAGRGLAMGAAVGALTLGSSGPYLVKAAGTHFDWRAVVIVASAAALFAAALLVLVRDGPHASAPAPVEPRRIFAVVRDAKLSLVNLGYFGHMWELYAMWAWFFAFVSSGQIGVSRMSPALLTFLAIAVGTFGCLFGGWLADRIGRPATAAAMMAISGACAAGIGLAAAGPAWLFVVIALVWGFTVVADSAQFSAMVTELSDPETTGAALALQTGVGYLLTIASIRLTPVVAEHVGWRWAFLLLIPGPVIGAGAMVLLRRTLAGTRTSDAGRAKASIAVDRSRCGAP